MLHLDVMTVTGKTLGENLEEIKKSRYYERGAEYLKKYGIKRTDVIKPFDEAVRNPWNHRDSLWESGAGWGRREAFRRAEGNVP